MDGPGIPQFYPHLFPTVPQRILRFLTLWLFVALQAMTPFIHAHADAAHADQGGILHLHQGLHIGVACDAEASDAHGVDVEVEQGVRVRDGSSDAVAKAPPAPSARLLRAALAARPGADFPTPSPLGLTPPEHALPCALAPPAA